MPSVVIGKVKGEKGEPGISPIINLEENESILTISVTDAEGTKSKSINTQENVQSDWNTTDTALDSFIKNKPEQLSQFKNDVGFLSKETDPTVPAWAKKSTKPEYTAAEVGALSSDVTHLSGDVPITRKVNGKALNADITLSAADVNADMAGSANSALNDAKSYTNTKISNLINGAPTTLDTLKEIADAMEENESIVESLDEAIGTKANQSALNSHTGNTTVHITATERTNWNDANAKKHEHSNKSVLDGTTASYTTAEKNKLSGIATGAEVNQNAFSNVKIGENTIVADSKTDTLTLAGSNVTITPDTTNDKVTIGITKDNVISALGYTPPTTVPSVGNGTITITQNGTTKGTFTTNQSGNTTIALTDTDTNTTYSNFVKSGSGAKAGLVPAPSTTAGTTKYLREDGTWTVPPNTNTTYSAATTSSAGLMSSADKVKLDGIVAGANKTTVDNTLSSTSTNPLQNKVVNSELAKKANVSHGEHVTYTTTAPKANGTASAGSATTVSRSDHVHPLQTSVTGSSGSCTGNSATATKATQDESGNNIKASYASSLSVSTNNKLTLKSKSGATLSTVDLSGVSGGGGTKTYAQSSEPAVSTTEDTVWLVY